MERTHPLSPLISPPPLHAGGSILRSSDIARKLQTLLPACRAAEQSARVALTHLQDEKERIQFAGFWQEHAKIVWELEDKIRWLGLGTEPSKRNAEPSLQLIEKEVPEDERLQILRHHENTDAQLLVEFEVLLQTPLPMDVYSLLKRHVAQIKKIWDYILERRLALRNTRPLPGIPLP